MHDWSLEITARDAPLLREAAALLAPGTQISVAALPGEALDERVAAALAARQLGLRPMPHLSARRLPSRAALDQWLSRLRAEAATDRVFVVGGDPATPHGPYADALAVIQSGLLEHHGIGKVGIAGYPEGHPQIDASTLSSALQAKRAALREAGHSVEIVTQFAFDADPILTWLERTRGDGITEPVRVGIPGPASAKTLLRFAARCGVAASAKALGTFGVSLTKLLSVSRPDQLVTTLLERLDARIHGEVRLHLYPFGGLRRAAEWMRDFEASERRVPA